MSDKSKGVKKTAAQNREAVSLLIKEGQLSAVLPKPIESEPTEQSDQPNAEQDINPATLSLMSMFGWSQEEAEEFADQH